MSGINPGIQPGQAGQTGSSSGADGKLKPKGIAGEAETDAFKDAVKADKKDMEKTEKMSPEDELKKIMSETSVRQFMERSKELTEETKKNF